MISTCTGVSLFLFRSAAEDLSRTSTSTEVIALENTLNGTIIPQDEVQAISDYAKRQNIKMHLDGARLWHVASIKETPLRDLCDPFDSVSLCFSKGLGMSLFDSVSSELKRVLPAVQVPPSGLF